MSTGENDGPVWAVDLAHTLTQSATIASGTANGKAKRKADASFERTDVAMADALVRRFRRELRYCGALGGWHHWTGTHWAADEQEHATECVKKIAREIADHAADNFDPGLLRDAKRIGSGPGAYAILKLARSSPGIVFAPADTNRDPWLACGFDLLTHLVSINFEAQHDARVGHGVVAAMTQCKIMTAGFSAQIAGCQIAAGHESAWQHNHPCPLRCSDPGPRPSHGRSWQ